MTKVYEIQVDRVMQDRFGGYSVNGTLKLYNGLLERGFTVYCDGIENQRMLKVEINFFKISDNTPIKQEYLKHMFKEICDCAYNELLNFDDRVYAN